MNSPTAVLLVSCTDQKGLVAEISSFVYRHGGNIVHAEQHIDVPQHIFFHRIEWELNGFTIPVVELENCFRPIAERFAMRWQLRTSMLLPRTAIFVSKYDHCLVDLLYRYRLGELPAQITAVVSNHSDLRSLVESHGLPFYVFAITPENKHRQEAAELQLLRNLNVELIVLARYMQVLTANFVNAFPAASLISITPFYPHLSARNHISRRMSEGSS